MGLAAALGVVNVLVILSAVALYLRAARAREGRGLSGARVAAGVGRGGEAGPAPRPGRRGGRGRAGRARVALAGLGWLVAGAVVAPYAVMFLTAAKPSGELRTTPPRLLPVRWQFENFAAVLADPGFQAWLRVSLVVAAASTALVVLASVPAAYYTARHRFRGRDAFLFLVLVTQMFSPTALVVGLLREFFELGLVNR